MADPSQDRVLRPNVSSWIAGLVALLAGAVPARGAPKEPGSPPGLPPGSSSSIASVPEPLRPWIPWVLHDDAERQVVCPSLHGDADKRVCAWPSRLELALDDKGGTFRQEWTVFRTGLAALPGDDEHWPQDVRVDRKTRPVVADDEKPAVEMGPGTHEVSGRFTWEAGLPDALAVPETTGLVALAVGGHRIDFPVRDAEGRVFLGRKEAPAEVDSVDIDVHRGLFDDTPLRLVTAIDLAVAGKSRELVLGRALPAGFEPERIEGGLPLRFDPDGHMHLQVRPGRWTVTVTARQVADNRSVARPAPDGLWCEGDEVWVFEARPELRLADVQGPPAIDPAQTTLPDDWKKLPAYAMGPGATLTLVERRRGAGEGLPDELELSRSLWLDFDGGGYTVSDRITGRFLRAWRLEAAPTTRLGRVAIDGQDQFITRIGGGSDGGASAPDGVEIRSGRANLTAESRIEGHRSRLPATGFRQDFQKVSATVAIPPGWELAHASGADNVSGTWIERWSLLRFFLVLVTTLAAQRLFGWRVAVLALLGMGLTITQPGGPAAVWLAVLLAEALVRALRTGKLGVAASVFRVGAWVAVAVVLLPFMVAELRRGLHPASAHERSLMDEVTSTFMIGGAAQDRSEVRGPPPERLAPAGVEAAMENLRSARSDEAGRIAGVVADAFQGVGGVGTVDGAGVAAKPAPKSEAKKAKMGGAQAHREPASVSLFGSNKQVQSSSRYVFDPGVVVQTGPGVPSWQWEGATLTFNGPVKPDQELRLILIPPAVNLVLSLLRVALLAALALSILRRPLRIGGGWQAPRPFLGLGGMAVLALALGLHAAAPARALAAETALPTPELLEQLKQRLLEPPRCAPDCGAISRLALEATPRELRLVLEASAGAAVAIPLPGNLKDWSPTTVTVLATADGKATKTGSRAPLARTDDGSLWLSLPSGTFRIELAGPLPSRDAVQIALPLRPHFVSARVEGWALDGLHDDGAVDESLKLSRLAVAGTGHGAPGAPEGAAAGGSLPPFLRVERTLHVGLRWEVDTLVRRETPEGTPVVVDVPLLAGEAVTTAGVRLDKGKGAVTVSLGPDGADTSWHSTLAETAQIHLRADPAFATRWSETWRLDLGSTWHATFGGIPAIHPAAAAHANASVERTAEWRPWPSEEVTIALSKPAGAGGRTLTIDSVSLAVTPGVRLSRAALTLAVRSSRGTQHTITLPEHAELESVTVDNTTLPLRLESDGRRLVLPVAPRKQILAITWRESAPLRALLRGPIVDLAAPATNVEIQFHLAEAPRWVLWTAGPRLGPAVHFWSVLLVLALVGWALGRTRLTPLRWWDWTLLGMGLAQLPMAAAIVVALFLLGLGLRARRPVENHPFLYNVSQLAFVGLAVASIAILFGAIEEGLVSHPDMRVVGNGSYESLLSWYQDRTDGRLPRPFMLSAPLMVYRGAMLAWSLWLAVAGLRWARWFWSCMRDQRWWQPLRQRVAATAVAAASPPSDPPAT